MAEDDFEALWNIVSKQKMGRKGSKVVPVYVMLIY